MRDQGGELKGLAWKLPHVNSKQLGKLGPAFGLGAGCGLGFGIGLLGGTSPFSLLLFFPQISINLYLAFILGDLVQFCKHLLTHICPSLSTSDHDQPRPRLVFLSMMLLERGIWDSLELRYLLEKLSRIYQGLQYYMLNWQKPLLNKMLCV